MTSVPEQFDKVLEVPEDFKRGAGIDFFCGQLLKEAHRTLW